MSICCSISHASLRALFNITKLFANLLTKPSAFLLLCQLYFNLVSIKCMYYCIYYCSIRSKCSSWSQFPSIFLSVLVYFVCLSTEISKSKYVNAIYLYTLMIILRAAALHQSILYTIKYSSALTDASGLCQHMANGERRRVVIGGEFSVVETDCWCRVGTRVSHDKWGVVPGGER